ncbi:MAG: glutamyl-tRNA reductase [Pseudomonadota bacterium]
MNIVVVGLNHKTAPIELREKFAFLSDEIGQSLIALGEAVILSTCNRVEIYTYGASEDAIKQWLCGRSDPAVALDDFVQHGYVLQGIEAVEHLMQVACGLDSLVLGEPEILGQVKAAFSQACYHKTVGPHLSRLFRKTFQVAKQIRTSTKIGACPVSVASTAVKFAKEWAVISNPRVLIIGSGEVGGLVAKHAQALTSHPLMIVSRNLENAQRLAHEVRGIAIDLQHLSEYLLQADIVISSTSSKTQVIHFEMIADVSHEMLMMDLAVPRDIAPEVKKHSNITLCQLDELKETIQQHVHMRAHAAMQAEKLIEEYAREFMLSLRSLTSDEIIKQYRANMEWHCDQALEKFSGQALTQESLREFSQQLLNKIMHLPSVQLRQASVEGRHDLLKSASEIFGIQGSIKP